MLGGIGSHMPIVRSYWYSTTDGETRFEVRGGRRWDAHELAELAADDYFHQHDGWDSGWPLTITIYETETGPAIGKFLVECEYEPAFSARPVEEP